MKNRMLRCVAWAATGVMAFCGVALIATALTGPGVAAAGQPVHEVQVVASRFAFENHDDIPHNVVSPEQKFKSPVLDTDEKFSHTFEAAGTYKYYCSIHPRMTGQVVVR